MIKAGMIGVISDTHDNLEMVRRAVRLFNDAGCSLVVHAGDFVAPFTARELHALKCPVRAVFGNCDGEKHGLAAAFQGKGGIQEPPLEFRHAGRSFLVHHLDRPALKCAESGSAEIIIFGHTHKPLIEKRPGVLLVNPGEAGGWLYARGSVVLLDPEKLEASLIYL
jgi:hypothetical protein